jgi:UDP-N-acetyl-D-mannosaminuronate dehydrogenase
MSSAECNLTSLGRKVNDSMPAYCVRQAMKLLEGTDVSKCTVALLGLAFRGGISDTRLSPTYKVIEELKKLKVKRIRVHDPFVESDPNLPEDITLTSNLSQAVKDADLVILVSDHPQYRNLRHEELNGTTVYDGRGILDKSRFAEGRFASIGRPS